MDKVRELVLCDAPDGLGSLLGKVPVFDDGRRTITAEAAAAGSLRCLRVLRAWPYPLTSAAWDAAATRGHLHILRFLHEESGVPCGKNTTARAAGSGHFNCLKYLHDINASWTEDTTHAAALGGQLDCLAYLIQNGCPVDPSACSAAARNGHIECLHYLHLKRCPWDQKTAWRAVNHSIFSCLNFAVEKGCPVDDDSFVAALEVGNFQHLEYLLRAGHRPKFPLKLRTLPDDSQVGCLELAASFGVRFSAGQLVLAASLGKLKHVRFLHSSGHSLWQTALDRFAETPSDWTRWRFFSKTERCHLG